MIRDLCSLFLFSLVALSFLIFDHMMLSGVAFLWGLAGPQRFRPVPRLFQHLLFPWERKAHFVSFPRDF